MSSPTSYVADAVGLAAAPVAQAGSASAVVAMEGEEPDIDSSASNESSFSLIIVLP